MRAGYGNINLCDGLLIHEILLPTADVITVEDSLLSNHAFD